MFQSKTSVAALSIFSNFTLTALKLLVGLSIGSISVIAEALHSGVDLLASVIAYVAVRMSGQPPDAQHQYGHGKVENVSGTIEAVLIFLAAGMIIWEASNKLLHGVPAPDVDLGLLVMGVSVLANILVSRRLLQVARRTSSVALEADAYHLTTDVLTSIGVFVGLVAVRVTGLGILDPLAALVVAGLIIRAAWDITRRSFVDLLDRSLPEREQQVVSAILEDHADQLAGFHALRTRRAGPERHIDLHLEVDADYSVAQAHALTDHLEVEIESALPNTDVVIHVEPAAPCRSSSGPAAPASGAGEGVNA